MAAALSSPIGRLLPEINKWENKPEQETGNGDFARCPALLLTHGFGLF